MQFFLKMTKKSQKSFHFLCRIFDSKKVQSVHNNKEWLDTTCNHTLFRMTDAFNLFFVKLAPLLLTDLLNQFEWCVLQDNDQLARSASSCLETLVSMSYEFDLKKIRMKPRCNQCNFFDQGNFRCSTSAVVFGC